MNTQEILKTKKTDILFVDPRNIVIVDGFNVREDLGDIESLAQSIKETGLQVPLKCVKVRGEDKYRLIDGHRRLKAINYLIENGVSFPYASVTLFQGNEEDEVFAMIITGTGQKQLNDIELAEGVKRLISFGYTNEEISRKIGKSVPHIYNLTYIGNFPKKVKELIIENKISSNTVLSISRNIKDGSELLSIVETAINDANKNATDGVIVKATPKNVGVLKNKSNMQKFVEVYKKLKENNINNEKTEWLEVIVNKSKLMSVDELIEMFS